MLKLWPEGCPSKKAGLIKQPDAMEKVMDHLDKIEADFGLTWPEGDPRTQAGVHADDLNTSNNPRSK